MHRTADPMHQPRMVRPPRGGGGSVEEFATLPSGNDLGSLMTGVVGIEGAEPEPTEVPSATPPVTPVDVSAPVGLGGITYKGGRHWAWASRNNPILPAGQYVVERTLQLPVTGDPSTTVTVLAVGLPRPMA